MSRKSLNPDSVTCKKDSLSAIVPHTSSISAIVQIFKMQDHMNNIVHITTFFTSFCERSRHRWGSQDNHVMEVWFVICRPVSHHVEIFLNAESYHHLKESMTCNDVNLRKTFYFWNFLFLFPYWCYERHLCIFFKHALSLKCLLKGASIIIWWLRQKLWNLVNSVYFK